MTRPIEADGTNAMREYCVYIMASQSRTLYVGVTSDLERRVSEHKNGTISGFTQKYNVTNLVWFEVFTEVDQAIDAEKRIKKWRREKKVALVEDRNPEWLDLGSGWG